LGKCIDVIFFFFAFEIIKQRVATSSSLLQEVFYIGNGLKFGVCEVIAGVARSANIRNTLIYGSLGHLKAPNIERVVGAGCRSEEVDD